MFLLPICYSTAARLHQTNSGEFLSLLLFPRLLLAASSAGGWLAGSRGLLRE